MLMDHVNRSRDARFPKRWEEQAIAMAMQSRWTAAAGLNNEILAMAPDDVGALNRLGRALMELGQFEESKEAYTRALAISPSNVIAQRNLSRLAALTDQGPDQPIAIAAKADLHMFIAEPGKAVITSIKLTGKTANLAKLAVGERVNLVVDNRSMRVADARGAVIGTLEPRLARRIIEMTNGGNRYDAALVSAADTSARVVIREAYQDASQVGQVSFPNTGTSAGTTALHGEIKEGLTHDDLDEDEAMYDQEEAAEDTDDASSGVEEEVTGDRRPDDLYLG